MAFEMAIKALEQEPMRDATPEERESIDAYIKSISKPIGIEFWDLADGEYISKQIVKEKMQYYGFHAPDMTITEFVEDLPSIKPQPCEDAVSRGVFEQVMWERDIAIQQLKELGYEFGEKIEPQTTNTLSCCDSCKRFNSRYTACMFCFKRNKEMREDE